MDIEYFIKNAEEVWERIRWKNGIICPGCGSEGYWKLGDGRYKCKKCGKIYSSTTGTLLEHSHLEKWQWLYCIYKMSNSKGISTIELSKDINVAYNTAYMMQQKIRYAMGREDISMEGIVRMDEAYIGGWSGMHFGRKMRYMKKNGYLDKDGKYTKSTLLAAVSKKKSHIVSMVGDNGKVRIVHTPNPITKDIVRQVIEKVDKGIEMLVTDESMLYRNLKWKVEQSCHSKAVFTTKSGLSSNVCENVFSWVKRKWNGIYTHTSEKYLQLYLNQIQWGYNNKDKGVEERFELLCDVCINCTVREWQIRDFDYLEGFVFEDVYNKEKEEAIELLNMFGGLVSEVETKHKMRYRGS